MSVVNYKLALLKAIESYELEKGKHLSKSRSNDITELKDILKKENNPRSLQAELLKKLASMKTGWWIFKTGKSQLKKYVLQVIRDPQNELAKLITEEMMQLQKDLMERMSEQRKSHEKMLNALQEDVNKLTVVIEEKRAILQELECQWHIKQQRLGKETYHFTFEEYIINLLDKFIKKNVLTELESEQLLNLLEYKKPEIEGVFKNDKSDQIVHKVTAAYEFALSTLINGADYLIEDNQCEDNTFKCIAKYADSYCHMLNNNKNCHPYLHGKMDKLLLSYYKDGAGKTTISSLPVHHKSAVLETKETLIGLYGSSSQSEAIAPLCELRMMSRWEDFKKKCLEKGKLLCQWLKKKPLNISQPVAENGVDSTTELKAESMPKI